MTLAGVAVGALLASVLGGCGGGDDTLRPDPTPPSAPEARARPLALQASPGPQDLLNWAELAFPQYFPGHQADQQYQDITFRTFPTTGNHVGLRGDRVLVMGPISGGQALDLGATSDFSCLMSPAVCAADKPIEARWSRVAAGPAHTLVVNAQGAGLGWGDGLAAVSAVALPGTPARALSGLNLVAGVSSGPGFTLATLRDGGVLYLNHGSKYPLVSDRNGTPYPSAVPMRALSGVVGTASCGEGTDVAVFTLRQDGSMTVFGVGALGISSTEAVVRADVPIRAFGTHMPGATVENCGLRALSADGRVWSLARRGGGKAKGINAELDAAVTAPLHDVACTGLSSTDHCLGVTPAGAVLAWGGNSAGQLGADPSKLARSSTTVTVTGLPSMARVWVGPGASYALSRDGSLYAWGAHRAPDTSAPAYQPRRQFAAEGPVADLAVADHLVLLMRDGTVRTWGANAAAQLGRADRAAATAPVHPAGLSLGTPDSMDMPPVARIANPTTPTQLKTPVALIDGGSRDADGEVLTHRWTLIARPAGSTASLQSQTGASSGITPDQYGTYTVALEVSDARSTSKSVQASVTIDEPIAQSSYLPAPLANELAILQSRNCLACHSIDKKVVGPSFQDIAKKYRTSGVATATLKTQLQDSILKGSVGRWGQVPMPPTTQGTAAELGTIVDWLLVRTPPKK